MDTLTTIPTTIPDPQTRKRKIQCKQELIIQSLQRFYSNRTDIQEIIEHLKGTSTISLRLIDWFVTNYSKTHCTSYILAGQEFVVYMNYKNQLKAYSKKLFDPFCRRERILFQIPNQDPIITTVGKLNFFRWAIEKDILTYIQGHQTEIEREMNVAMREQAKVRSTPTSETSTASASTTTSTGTRKRQSKDSVSTIKLLQKHECEIVVGFD